jgi:hypothetical protein
MDKEKGPRPKRKSGAEKQTDGDSGPSANSVAKRPSTSYSLSRELLERLSAQIPARERSKVVEKAVTRYLDDLNADRETIENLADVAAFLFERKHLFDIRQGAVEERLTSVEANLEFISSALERLFHIRRKPLTVVVPTEQEFVDLLSDASSEYIRNRDLLAPALESLSALEKAAKEQVYENRVKEIEYLLNSMPFMSDPRFFCDRSRVGVAIYDREFSAIDEYSSLNGYFPVVEVQPDLDGMSLWCPVARPFFRLGFADRRDRDLISGVKAVADLVPLMVADYITFRQLNGSIPEISMRLSD